MINGLDEAMREMEPGMFVEEPVMREVMNGLVAHACQSRAAPPLKFESRSSEDSDPILAPFDSRVAIFKKKTSSCAIDHARRVAQGKADEYVEERRVRKGTKSLMESADEATDDVEFKVDESKKRRYARRLELNRESAGVSRVRRKAYIEGLEAQVERIEQEKNEMERKLEVACAENLILKVKLDRMYALERTDSLLFAENSEVPPINFSDVVARNATAA